MAGGKFNDSPLVIRADESEFANSITTPFHQQLRIRRKEIGNFHSDQLSVIIPQQIAGGGIHFNKLSVIIGNQNGIEASLKQKPKTFVASLQRSQRGEMLDGIAD